MEKPTVSTISWNYDLKRILLGEENYDEDNPIKNILMGKDKKYYQDISGLTEKSDYYTGSRGDVENYKIVHDVFRKLTGGRVTEHKDIMNSFWTTYKILLQIEYPKFFRPDEIIGENKKNFLNEVSTSNLSKVSIKFPPYNSRKTMIISDEYFTYFDKYEFEINQGDTWIDFLLKNFKRFDKVHENLELKKFAKRTHTIGNITVVPKGFNTGRQANDYWDFGLQSLQDFLTSFDSWDNYVETYCMQPFLTEENKPVSLWKGHLEEQSAKLPQDEVIINMFLSNVNRSIEARGILIMSNLRKYSHELWE